MTPDQPNALIIIASFVAFAFLYRRREAIRHALRGTVIALLFAGAAYFLLWNAGLTPPAAYISALVIGVLIRRAQPARSRYISTRARRQAIAKWERETGQTFNRRIHELDHVLAHSRGGGSAEDNIQVLTRKKNRSKGAKRDWRDSD